MKLLCTFAIFFYSSIILHAQKDSLVLLYEAKTDSKGKFELHTVKPSDYLQSDLPAHIYVHENTAGYEAFVSELLFDDDERLVGNIREQSIRNKFIISKPEKATSPFVQQFSNGIT